MADASDAELEEAETTPSDVGQKLASSDAAASSSSAAVAESREEMLARHRKDIKELQAKEMALKKSAAKGSKAEQKTKKKEVDDEIARLDKKMKSRHAAELAALGFGEKKTVEEGEKPIRKSKEEAEKERIETLVRAMAGVSTGAAAAQGNKPSKAQKRREKRQQQEVDREKRIQEEQDGVVSDRAVEDRRLGLKLHPQGLTLREIKPDGHCLYRAVEDQLTLHGPSSSVHNHLALRSLAAGYMRAHPEDFMPFIDDDEGDEGRISDMGARFERYCLEVESTAAWGGQLELGALSHVLRRHITVYSADLPDVEMGQEYSNNSSAPPLKVSYHRRAYGLGEHYNSVVPVSAKR